MKRIRSEAKSVEEALEQIKRKYDIREGEYEYRVVDKGFKGIFGLMSRNAVVEVTLNRNYYRRRVEEFLRGILEYAGRIDRINIKTNDRTYFIDIDGEDIGKLIGRHGKTLGALQHIVSIFLNRLSDVKLNVVIDVGEYRERRKKQLEQIAKEAIRKALEEKGKVVLDPMFPFERRIVHEIVKKHPKVTSYSIGVEPYRRVVIEYSRNGVKSGR